LLLGLALATAAKPLFSGFKVRGNFTALDLIAAYLGAPGVG